MYVGHQGGQSVRTVVSAPHIGYKWDGAPATLRGLSSSASVKGKTLTVTLTNLSIDTPRETEIVLRGGSAKSVNGQVLTASDVHAHNSFESPDNVQPKAVQNAELKFTMRPTSVMKFEVKLG
jgi:alpha-N-arabinofuranosidase